MGHDIQASVALNMTTVTERATFRLSKSFHRSLCYEVVKWNVVGISERSVSPLVIVTAVSIRLQG